MGRRKLFDISKELMICNEYRNGNTLKELVYKYGTTQVSLSRILKRNGFKSRINKESGKLGKYCSRYIGGKYKNHKGYVCLYLPNYKWCHKGGWIQEHRYIVQNHIKRRLKPIEHIHHINGIKDDNRIENLQIIKAGEHTRLHAKLRKGEI